MRGLGFVAKGERGGHFFLNVWFIKQGEMKYSGNGNNVYVC